MFFFLATIDKQREKVMLNLKKQTSDYDVTLKGKDFI